MPLALHGLPFRLVAEADGSLQLGALGDVALLSKGFWGRVFYLLTQSGAVREVEGLNGFIQQDNAGPSFWVAGGTWPNDAWLALSKTSDAGPSWAWIYQWAPASAASGGSHAGRWVLRREHGRSIGQLLPWRGGIVAVSISPQIPRHVLVDLSAIWLGPSKQQFLGVPSCRTPAPWYELDGFLVGLGYPCDDRGRWAEPLPSLVAYRWESRGKRAEESLPLPPSFIADGHPEHWRTFVDGKELLMLNTGRDVAEPRFVRLEGQRWVPAGELPDPFTVVDSSDHSLWVLSSHQLLHWRGGDWNAVARLPRSAPSSIVAFRSTDDAGLQLWARSESDIWLITAGDGGSQLWNTAGGRSTVTFLTDEEEGALASKRGEWDDRCSHVMVDVVALQGIPINAEPWDFSVNEGRALIRQALRERADLRGLPFFLYESFGFDCIGARVPDAATGQALREAVKSYEYDHQYSSPLHCGPQPGSTPIRVFP